MQGRRWEGCRPAGVGYGRGRCVAGVGWGWDAAGRGIGIGVGGILGQVGDGDEGGGAVWDRWEIGMERGGFGGWQSVGGGGGMGWRCDGAEGGGGGEMLMRGEGAGGGIVVGTEGGGGCGADGRWGWGVWCAEVCDRLRIRVWDGDCGR